LLFKEKKGLKNGPGRGGGTRRRGNVDAGNRRRVRRGIKNPNWEMLEAETKAAEEKKLQF